MHSSSPPLRLTSPTDLLCVIPYLLGYHPAASVVCMAVSDGRCALHVNTTLESIADHGAGAAAASTARLAAEHADTVIVVGYGTADQVDDVVAEFETTLTAARITVPFVLRSTAGRYYCLTSDCDCPADGVAYDPSTSAVAVQMVVDGYTALPSRAALAAVLDPVTGPRRNQSDAAHRSAIQRLRKLLHDTVGAAHPMPPSVPRRVLQAGVDALHDALRAAAQGRVLSDDDVAWLAVLLPVPGVKVAALQSSSGDGSQQQLWTDVVRRARPALTAVPTLLLANTAYQAGNSTMANIAVERLLQIEPGNPWAHLLAHALDSAIPPAAWRDMLQAATGAATDSGPATG